MNGRLRGVLRLGWAIAAAALLSSGGARATVMTSGHVLRTGPSNTRNLTPSGKDNGLLSTFETIQEAVEGNPRLLPDFKVALGKWQKAKEDPVAQKKTAYGRDGGFKVEYVKIDVAALLKDHGHATFTKDGGTNSLPKGHVSIASQDWVATPAKLLQHSSAHHVVISLTNPHGNVDIHNLSFSMEQ